MKCALIGTSKIAEVHLVELIKIGAKKLTIISRNFNRGKDLCKKYKSQFPKITFEYAKKEILKEQKFDLIDICTSNNTHDLFLKYINKSNSIILVEKPIISLLKINKKYKEFLDKIYKHNNKVAVCYPMIFMAKYFKKYFKKNGVSNTFTFLMKTGGRYKRKYINIDLMPHALTFIYSFFSNKLLLKKELKINQIKISENDWKSSFTLNKQKFLFNLTESKKKKTSLEIKYSGKKIVRKTKIINNKFINYLIYKNMQKQIKNPMSEFFADLKKNKNKKIFFKRNKELTYQIMDINFKFLN